MNYGYFKDNAGKLLAHFLYDRRKMKTPVIKQIKYSPFLAQLVVTRKCNLACGYCNEYDRDSPPVPLETLLRRVTLLRDLGTLAIEFTGGEPLLHPNIAAVVERATNLRFPARMMISNAFLMTTEKINELNRAGLTHLQVSVDGVKPNATTRKTLDLLRGRLNELAARAKFEVTLSAVIGAGRPGEAEEVIEFARSRGFKPRALLLHDGAGQLSVSQGELAQYESAAKKIGSGYNESLDYRRKLAQGGRAAFKCRSGSRYLYVDEYGIVRCCSQSKGMLSVPLEEYDASDLETAFYMYKPCCKGCTVGCARTASKLDEFRPQPGFEEALARDEE